MEYEAEAETEPSAPATNADDELAAPELIEAEMLIEEISIDGMCGVY
jgi:mycofactocin precursor